MKTKDQDMLILKPSYIKWLICNLSNPNLNQFNLSNSNLNQFNSKKGIQFKTIGKLISSCTVILSQVIVKVRFINKCVSLNRWQANFMQNICFLKQISQFDLKQSCIHSFFYTVYSPHSSLIWPIFFQSHKLLS